MFRIHCALAFAVAVPAFASSVVYVDNSRPAGGDGTAAAPFATIGAAGRSAVIYVEETATPYAENVSLVKGQKLIGSAYGLDALRAEAAIDANVPAAPARQGAGPVIRGTINLAGDNIVAGCTVIADRSAGITSSDGDGIVSLRSVFFQTSHHGFAIYMLRHHGAVSITGGGIQAMDEGSGITLIGGDGDVMIERFPLTGSFHSAVRVSDRDFGAVTFRNGTSIGTDSATDDAVVVANMAVGAPVTFSDRIHIRGSRRGFVAAKVFKLVVNGGDSWLSTTGAAALDLRDVGADVVFVAVSSEAAPEGLVADKVRGKFQITGRESEPGSGGTIRAAKNYGARIVQSSGVRLANMTLIGSGSKAAAKGAKCSGDFDTTSVVPCNAALYLRHLEGGSFENIVIDGGGQIGLNASNIRRVTFENLDIHGAGDQLFEAGVLLQEVGQAVRFSRSSFADNAGSEVTIEQRFNTGAVSFERCSFSSNGRPTIAPQLLGVRLVGAGALDIDVRNSQFHDIAGDALHVAISGTSTLHLSVADSGGDRLGTGGTVLHAAGSAHATLSMTGTRWIAPAAASVVEVSLSESATACVDLASNTLQGGQAILLTGAAPASLVVVTRAERPGDVQAALAAANNGARTVLQVTPMAVSVAAACH